MGAEEFVLGLPSSIWTALIAAGVGGVFVKLVDRWFRRGDRRLTTEAAAMSAWRDDVVREIGELRGQIRALGTELDVWRDRYYKLFNRYGRMRNYVRMIVDELQALLEAGSLDGKRRLRLAAVLHQQPDIDDDESELDPDNFTADKSG
jgi:hypothetical protein